jgi:hypothetical protein
MIKRGVVKLRVEVWKFINYIEKRWVETGGSI